jgi:Rha family phage regulatory protein
VSAFFEKQHKDVLKAIRNLIEQEPELERNFAPFTIQTLTDPNYGKASHYQMDRDGFTLLAMGFTGASALAWKLRYIGAFNYRRRPHRFRRMFSV